APQISVLKIGDPELDDIPQSMHRPLAPRPPIGYFVCLTCTIAFGSFISLRALLVLISALSTRVISESRDCVQGFVALSICDDRPLMGIWVSSDGPVGHHRVH